MDYKDILTLDPMHSYDSKIAEVFNYCKLGWPIHPLNGKLPLLKNWQNKATTDLNLIRFWLKQWPQANLGIITGLTILRAGTILSFHDVESVILSRA